MKPPRDLRLLTIVTDMVILALIALAITVIIGGWWLGY